MSQKGVAAISTSTSASKAVNWLSNLYNQGAGGPRPHHESPGTVRLPGIDIILCSDRGILLLGIRFDTVRRQGR
jgi:hypothetical protein